MLRGLRNRSTTRRSPLSSSSEEDEEYVGRTSKPQTTQQVITDRHTLPHTYTVTTVSPKTTQHVKESRSAVSVSSSCDGSLFSVESHGMDDENQDTGNDLSHENYLNDKIPDLEEILRSFGSKSRKSSNNRRYNNESMLQTHTLLNTDDLNYDDDRDSNDSSYNSGFSSSSSDSSFESVPDTTQIAVFYNRKEQEHGSFGGGSNNVTLSPTSTTDVEHFGTPPSNDESVPHKVKRSSPKGSSKRQRKERRRQSRTSKLNKNISNSSAYVVVDNYNNNDDDNRSRQSFLSRTNSLINTSKSFGKTWARKKRMDQIIVANLSDDENKEKKLLLITVPSLSINKTPPLSADQAHVPSAPNVTTNATEPPMIIANEISKAVSINKLNHVIERFDCDTGALITDNEAGGPSKRSSSPTSSLQATKEHPDPLALPGIKTVSESHSSNSDNESPRQKSCGSSGDAILRDSNACATNVIENMVLLFARSDVEGIRRLLGESIESSVSSLSTSSSTLSRDKALDEDNKDCDYRDGEEGLSDDKGGSDKQEAKHLRPNRLLDTKGCGAYKQPSKSLQAQYLSDDYTLPLSMRGIVTHYSISILLIEPINKLFEIVTVDVTRSMSLRDTLADACTAAADPILSKQTYVSLCSDVKVLSNMTSPVSKLIQKPTSPPGHGKENVWLKNNRESDKNNNMNEKQRDGLMRREMERQLLVAVPVKSNFKECQMIRRILWKNTRLQLWWITYQTKNEHYDTPW